MAHIQATLRFYPNQASRDPYRPSGRGTWRIVHCAVVGNPLRMCVDRLCTLADPLGSTGPKVLRMMVAREYKKESRVDPARLAMEYLSVQPVRGAASPLPSVAAKDEEPGRIPELENTRRHAGYWEECARNEPERESALQHLHQAMLSWKNAAYAAWDKIKTPPSAISSISFDDILKRAGEIERNGIALKRYGGDNMDEGRCRELCAMYLRDMVAQRRMQQKLDGLVKDSDSSTRPA